LDVPLIREIKSLGKLLFVRLCVDFQSLLHFCRPSCILFKPTCMHFKIYENKAVESGTVGIATFDFGGSNLEELCLT